MNPDTTYYSSKSPIVIPMGAYAAPWVVNGDGPGGPESVSAATTISDNVVFAQLSVDVGPDNKDRRSPARWASPARSRPTVHHARHFRRDAARDGRRLRHPGERRHPSSAAGDRQGRAAQRPRRLEAQDEGAQGYPGRRRQRRHPVSGSESASSGTGSPSGSYFPYTRAGKTGTTDNGWDVWYVGYTPQLAASVWMGDAAENSPMDGAYGGTYCAPMWAKFFAAALKEQAHPDFTFVPWIFSPWHGKMQGMSPSASPSTSGSASPSPGPTKTIKPTVQPTPQPTPTTPKPTPTAPQPTPTAPQPTPTAPQPTPTPS